MSREAWVAAYIASGGGCNNTHSFDRYITGQTTHRRNTYVPRSGSHDIVDDTGRGRTRVYTWIGSAGATFEERVGKWMATLEDSALEAATLTLEEWLLAGDADAPVWFAAALAEGKRRSLAMVMPVDPPGAGPTRTRTWKRARPVKRSEGLAAFCLELDQSAGVARRSLAGLASFSLA